MQPLSQDAKELCAWLLVGLLGPFFDERWGSYLPMPRGGAEAIAQLMNALHLSRRYPNLEKSYTTSTVFTYKAKLFRTTYSDYAIKSMMLNKPHWLPQEFQGLGTNGFTIQDIESCTRLFCARSQANYNLDNGRPAPAAQSSDNHSNNGGLCERAERLVLEVPCATQPQELYSQYSTNNDTMQQPVSFTTTSDLPYEGDLDHLENSLTTTSDLPYERGLDHLENSLTTSATIYKNNLIDHPDSSLTTTSNMPYEDGFNHLENSLTTTSATIYENGSIDHLDNVLTTTSDMLYEGGFDDLENSLGPTSDSPSKLQIFEDSNTGSTPASSAAIGTSNTREAFDPQQFSYLDQPSASTASLGVDPTYMPNDDHQDSMNNQLWQHENNFGNDASTTSNNTGTVGGLIGNFFDTMNNPNIHGDPSSEIISGLPSSSLNSAHSNYLQYQNHLGNDASTTSNNTESVERMISNIFDAINNPNIYEEPSSEMTSGLPSNSLDPTHDYNSQYEDNFGTHGSSITRSMGVINNNGEEMNSNTLQVTNNPDHSRTDFLESTSRPQPNFQSLAHYRPPQNHGSQTLSASDFSEPSLSNIHNSNTNHKPPSMAAVEQPSCLQNLLDNSFLPPNTDYSLPANSEMNENSYDPGWIG